jgi:hypothetical protein
MMTHQMSLRIDLDQKRADFENNNERLLSSHACGMLFKCLFHDG